MVVYNLNNKNVYIEKAVANVLDRKCKEIEQDGDLVGGITAGEGYGKSTLAQSIGGYFAYKFKTKFSVDNIHFDTDSFIEFANKAPPYTVVILDESRADLYRGSSNSNKNKRFTHWLSQCRSKNLILLFVIPSIHDFDPYINKWRLSLWIEVVRYKDKDGIYRRGFYNLMAIGKRKLFLKYLKDKYSKTPRGLKALRGKFEKVTPIDKTVYENKKNKQINKRFEETKEENKPITLTPRQIEVLSKISPANNWKKGEKDYEILQKLVNSLRKLRLEKSV